MLAIEDDERPLSVQLREIAENHYGRDLSSRLALADAILKQQADSLLHAAEEIERLQATVKELEQRATANTQP